MYKKGIKILLLAFIMVLCTGTLGAINTKEGEKKETNNKTAEEIEGE